MPNNHQRHIIQNTARSDALEAGEIQNQDTKLAMKARPRFQSKMTLWSEPMPSHRGITKTSPESSGKIDRFYIDQLKYAHQIAQPPPKWWQRSSVRKDAVRNNTSKRMDNSDLALPPTQEWNLPKCGTFRHKREAPTDARKDRPRHCSEKMARLCLRHPRSAFSSTAVF
jgi:hypothetical protein